MVLHALLMLALAQTVPETEPVGEVEEAEKAAEAEEEQKEHGFDLLAIPIPNFNSDLGFGAGVAAGLFIYGPGYRPYRLGLAAETFFTTRGAQINWLRLDAPELLHRTRVEARLEYFKQPFSPYYGAGNMTAPGMSSVPGRKNPFFSYDRMTVGGWVRARFTPLGEHHPFQPYIGYGNHWQRVRVGENTLLEEQQPLGVDGGTEGYLQFGLAWDSRDSEGNPTEGGLAELSSQTYLRAFGSRFNYEQVTISVRRYFSKSPKLIFAFRGAVDALFGNVPFYAWPTSGGLNYFGGIGGESSVRGIPWNRYAGNLKAVLGGEVRWMPFEFRLLKVNTRLGTAAFVDAGRVWQPGVPDGAFWAFHPGAGAGLRLARREVALRADYAVWLETGHMALYLTFGQAF